MWRGAQLTMRISIVIPAMEESAIISTTLAALQPLRQAGHEVILVDGGSSDGTAEIAQPLVDRVIVTARGRARQMNAGAYLAQSDVLLFLHADTLLPSQATDRIVASVANGAAWGWFDVRLSGQHFLLRVIEHCMSWRAYLTRIATGDQAIFVRRDVFLRIGGYPDLALMEDVALCKLLRKNAASRRLRLPVLSSSRRWEQHGMLRTILLMWWLRLVFAFGADSLRVAARYDSRSR